MRLSLCFLLTTGYLWAQGPGTDKNEQAAFQRAKSTLVSSLDRSLPKVTLEFFLLYEGGGTPINWEVNNCTEQAGKSVTDHGSDPPICVEADFAKGQTSVSVVVSVGTTTKGLSSTPAVFRVTVSSPSGSNQSLRRLGDLPKELHRPVPKSPRDLPVPITAFSG